MKPCKFFPFLSCFILNLTVWSNVRTVEVITPEIRDLTITTSQPAFVEAYHAAQIGARVSGIAHNINADIGQKVKAGDVLAVIDAPELFRRRDAVAAEKQVASTKLSAEKANLTATEAETERILNLVKNNSVTAKAGDEATKKLESAKAQFAAAEASLKAAVARLSEAEAMLAYTNLKAPFEGVVTQRNLDPGDTLVGDIGKTLFEVVQTSKLRVVIHVPEKDSHLLDIGDPASLNFNALPSRNIQGSVSRMAMALSPKSQRMRVEVDIESSDTRLYPGSYGQAVITLAQKENAVTISSSAVRFHGGSPIVYVVTGGKIVHQPVTLGMDQGAWIEVTSGLSGNEQVVSGSIDRLPVGTAVNLR